MLKSLKRYEKTFQKFEERSTKKQAVFFFTVVQWSKKIFKKILFAHFTVFLVAAVSFLNFRFKAKSKILL